MFPCNAFYNLLNRCATNSKIIGKFLECCFSNSVLLSDSDYLAVGKLGRWMGFSINTIKPMTALAHHIIYIVLLCTSSEMVRIAAQWISDARMEYVGTWRNIFPVINYPCYFVYFSNNVPLITPNRKISVPGGTTRHPSPAFILTSEVNIKPKPLLKRFREYLLQKVCGDRFRLHDNQASFGCCATPSSAQTLRGHFYFNL